MRSDRVDQAEGLRRLLVRNQTRVVTVVSGKSGVGRTSTTINLAAALARSGKDVLVLDQNHAPNNFLGGLGLFARHDLIDAVDGKCTPQQAVLTAHGFSVLPAARAISTLARTNHVARERMENALAEVSGSADIILVDADMRVQQAAISAGQASGSALLVVTDATAGGITESYALIKRLAQANACLKFEIVVNKISSEKEAETVFGNMAKVAHRNLAARLEYSGCIPNDDKLKRATQLCKPVSEAFPAAISVKHYMELAQKLLCLSVPQSEMKGAAASIMQGLMMHVAHPSHSHSREMAHVVN